MVRIKNRYLVVNILYPELEKGAAKTDVPDAVVFHQPTERLLDSQAMVRGIRKEVSHLFGDYGSGAITNSLQVKYLSTHTSTFILRVSRDHYRIVWAALSMMNRVPLQGGRNCVFRVVRVSGTIKMAEQEVISMAREMMLKAQREPGGSSDATLKSIFGDANQEGGAEDVLMVDRSDSEDDEASLDCDG